MSIRIAQSLTRDLPYSLQEQVLSYARSVEAALPDIQAEAGVDLTEGEQEQILLLAALRKLHGICASSYWAVENAGAILARQDTWSVRIGGTSYSRGGDFHTALRVMLNDLETVLLEAGITQEWLDAPFDTIAQLIVSERRQN